MVRIESFFMLLNVGLGFVGLRFRVLGFRVLRIHNIRFSREPPRMKKLPGSVATSFPEALQTTTHTFPNPIPETLMPIKAVMSVCSLQSKVFRNSLRAWL